jgi:hypothetical protein
MKVILNVPNEGYSRDAPCPLTLISTLLLLSTYYVWFTLFFKNHLKREGPHVGFFVCVCLCVVFVCLFVFCFFRYLCIDNCLTPRLFALAGYSTFDNRSISSYDLFIQVTSELVCNYIWVFFKFITYFPCIYTK